MYRSTRRSTSSSGGGHSPPSDFAAETAPGCFEALRVTQHHTDASVVFQTGQPASAIDARGTPSRGSAWRGLALDHLDQRRRGRRQLRRVAASPAAAAARPRRPRGRRSPGRAPRHRARRRPAAGSPGRGRTRPCGTSSRSCAPARGCARAAHRLGGGDHLARQRCAARERDQVVVQRALYAAPRASRRSAWPRGTSSTSWSMLHRNVSSPSHGTLSPITASSATPFCTARTRPR